MSLGHLHAALGISTLILLNPSPLRAATATVQVRGADGSPTAVSFDGEFLATGRKTVNIPPLGCVQLTTTGNAVVGPGSVEVTSDIPVGGVVLFSSPAFGTAGVGESFPDDEIVVPVDRDKAVSNRDTGIAAVNPLDEDIVLEVTVRNANGNVIRGPVDVHLIARGQFAAFPNEAPLNLNLPDPFVGSIWVRVKSPEGGVVAMTVINQGLPPQNSPAFLTTFFPTSVKSELTFTADRSKVR